MPRAPNGGDWLALLTLTLLWGTAFAFNEFALASFSPAMLVFGRVSIAACVLLVLMRAHGIRLPRSPRGWVPMGMMAIFGNLLPFHLVAWAQLYIDSSVAGVLMAIMPLFVLTLAHFFVPGARLTPRRIAGFSIGFAGVVCVIGPDALQTLEGNLAFWAALAVLGAALSYAVNSIYARRLGATDPVQLSAGMLLVAALLGVPSAAQDLPTLAAPTVTAAAALVFLGLFSTGLATVLYFRVVQGPGPTFLSLVNYLVPAWAVLAGAWLLDESLAITVYAGLGLILAGIAVSEFRPRTGRNLETRGPGASARTLAHAAADDR